eukprot:4030686-Heterocapsa_arctica.AAC.1
MMLTSVASEKEQMSIAAEGFGSYDQRTLLIADDHRKSHISSDHDKSGEISEARKVLFKPMVGLFNQDKLIPIRYLPLQIELEL